MSRRISTILLIIYCMNFYTHLRKWR